MDKNQVKEYFSVFAHARDYFDSEIANLKWNGVQAMGLCPFHDDNKASLSVKSDGVFYCHACNAKGDIIEFHMKRYNLSFTDAVKELAQRAGIYEIPKKIVAVYDYQNIDGKVIFQTVKLEPKDFRQRRPDPQNADKWIWDLKGIELMPYNLPAILKSDYVILVEGEKDADSLKAIGFVASCNPLGAGKWRPEYNQHFHGKRIYILPDNDRAGKDHALSVARSLKPVAKTLKLIELDGLPEKGDVSDWIEFRKREGKLPAEIKEELASILRQAPEWVDAERQAQDFTDSLPLLSDLGELNLKCDYLLEGIIPENSVTVFYGRGGRGKTSLMVQVAYCISQGVPFLGIPTKKTTIVYIDYDNPISIISEKARRLGKTPNFYYWHYSHAPAPPKIDKDTWVKLKKLPKNSLLIFDTLKTCQNLDMDKDNTMAFILGRFRELQAEGFSIVILHHSNRKDQIKNNTTITDNADHVICLKPSFRSKADEDSDEEPEHVSDLVFGCLQDDKSRFPKKHIYLTFDGEVFEEMPDPDTELYHQLLKIMSQLSENGLSPNQTKIIEEARRQFGFSRQKTLDLLIRGENKFWTSKRVKEQKNQKVYFQFSSSLHPIWRKTGKLANSAFQNDSENSLKECSQTVDAVEFSSFPSVFRKTQKTDENQFSGEHGKLVDFLESGRKTEINLENVEILEVIEPSENP